MTKQGSGFISLAIRIFFLDHPGFLPLGDRA